MGKIFIYLLVLLCYCTTKKDVDNIQVIYEKPVVTENGRQIHFPDPIQVKYFESDTVKPSKISAELTAPANVVASVIKNLDSKTYSLVVFSNPALTANFSSYLERLVNIKTYKLNLERINDLYLNGAATGRELIEGKTQLQNEEAAIIENQAMFLQAGLDPEDFKSHQVGVAWLICDIAENEIDKFKEGGTCKIHFKAYEDEVFTGKIETIAEVVDNVTRMTKLRVEMKNGNNKIKAGMFATVEFAVSDGNYLSIPSKAIITVQGKDYVFVQKTLQNYERREVETGKQINSYTVIYSGLNKGESVITSGGMQLKGLSFGY